jgi:outer membrane protein assembly factor BamB
MRQFAGYSTPRTFPPVTSVKRRLSGHPVLLNTARALVSALASILGLLPLPARPADSPAMEERVRALVEQLGSDDFQKRESATVALEQLGDDALPFVQEARQTASDAEVVARLDRLLGSFHAADTLWTSPPLGRMESPPVVGPGRLFVGTDSPQGFGLACLSTKNGALQWKADLDAPLPAAPAVEGNRVFCADRDGVLRAIDVESGKPVWTRALGAEVHAPLAVVEGRVYVARADGKVGCLQADTGAPVWEFAMGAPGKTRSGPSVADGCLYVGGRDSKVYALDAATGKKRWEFAAGGFIATSPAVSGGRVFVGSLDRKLYALASEDGRKLWEFATRGPLLAQPAILKDRVMLLTSDKKLYALSVADGQPAWSAAAVEGPGIAPVAAAGFVFWVQEKRSLVCGHARDGSVLWTKSLNCEAIFAGPVLSGHRLLVSDLPGRLHCVASGVVGPAAWPMVGGNTRRTGCLEAIQAAPFR